MKSNKGLSNLVEKHVTESNGWKLEQEKSKLGREQGDYSYPDLFTRRPMPFYNQICVWSTMD